MLTSSGFAALLSPPRKALSSASVKDPYGTLGVSKDASESEVKKAYRKLTQQFHPDKNPGDKSAEERFKGVSQAYEILGDSDKRKLFDEFGEMSLTQGFDAERARAYQQARGGYGGGFGPGMGGFDLGSYGNARETSFDDLLSSLFGGGSVNLGGGFGRQAGPRKGQDITGDVKITFEQALLGTTVPLRIDAGGEARTLDVKIPMGFKDGAKLRLRGQGGQGQPRGDIMLTIRVGNSKKWTRKGDNLEGVMPVPVLAAYRGGPVDVDTPWGQVSMKIPAGTQGGQTLRLKGRGVRYKGDKRTDGNLIMRVQLVLPPAGNEPLLEALEALQGEVRPLEEAASGE
jgi:DnaJ-class molecular chaperone